jgi:hypothetical protein
VCWALQSQGGAHFFLLLGQFVCWLTFLPSWVSFICCRDRCIVVKEGLNHFIDEKRVISYVTVH